MTFSGQKARTIMMLFVFLQNSLTHAVYYIIFHPFFKNNETAIHSCGDGSKAK
jgi:hypothetical protein